jgi:hypothetical protein
LAFVFDTSKITFKKMAGQIALPKDKPVKVGSEAEGNLEGLKFVRTPYCLAFQAGWFKFAFNDGSYLFRRFICGKKEKA